MNRNQKLAVEFATQALNSREVLMSDQFFAPFNKAQGHEICMELLAKELMVLEFGPGQKGACIVKISQCTSFQEGEVKAILFTGKQGNCILSKLHKFSV